MSRRSVDVLLILGVVALVAVSLLVGAPRSTGGEGEQFGGTDAQVTETLETAGHEPWFEPLFSPDSGEVESGLFALQAALGAGVLGYCLGRLRGRRSGRRSRRAAVPDSARRPDHADHADHADHGPAG